MIVNSVLTRTSAFLYGSNSLGQGQLRQPAGQQTTMHMTAEYFVSASHLAAKSDIDYLVSPVEQIRDQFNKWFADMGGQMQMQCDDATWVVPPSAQIPAEFFDSYEPFFRTVLLYRAQVGAFDEGDQPNVPSDPQMNAAFLGLANLMASLVPAPSPMLLEDGTVGGYWRRGRCYVSIDFEADGEHTWVGTDGVKFHSGRWCLPGNPMPPALTNELRAIVA